MKKLLPFIAATIFAAPALAETLPTNHCDQMMAYGYPRVAKKVEMTPLCRISYFVLHNDETRMPLYAAEYLLPENLGGTSKRVNGFKPDPDLPKDKRAELHDYEDDPNDQYDRGHMAPFENSRSNSAAALQTFYLSNMIPQNKFMNRGIWRVIERRANNFVRQNERGLYVYTGPVFNGTYGEMGRLPIPTMMFKVIIDKQTKQGVAYLVPNRNPQKGERPDDFKVTITEVERVTGYDFTPKLLDGSFKAVIGQQFK